MNIWGKSARSWRRKNSRAVSPIIATILLVAITVVLAAVLYVLVSQYTKSGSGSTPLSITFSNPITSKSAGGTNFDNVSISASSGLTTGMFGLKITTATGTTLSTWTQARLYSASGSLLATFTLTGASWDNVVSVNNSETLAIVSPSGVSVAGDTLNAYSLGSATVSGSGPL